MVSPPPALRGNVIEINFVFFVFFVAKRKLSYRQGVERLKSWELGVDKRCRS